MANKLLSLLRPRRADFILFAILTCSLCLLFYPEYSTDSYVIAANGVKEYSEVAFNSGRAVSALFFFVVGALCSSFYFLYYVSFILSLVCATLSVKLLAKELERFGVGYTYVISVLIVLNPLCLEYFLFAEKGMFFLGILFTVIAFKLFCRFNRERLYALPLCALFVGLTAFIYQPLCALFVPLVLLKICLGQRDTASIFKDTAFAALAYGFGLLLDVLFLAIFSVDSRMESFNLSNLAHAFSFGGLWQSALIYLGFIVASLLLVLFFGYRVGYSYKSRELRALWLKCLFISFGTLCAVLMPFLLVATDEIWFPFRIMYPLGALVGVLTYLIKYELFPSFSFKKRVGVAVICVFFALEVIFLEVLLVGRIINNSTDHSLCRQIGEEISAYEERTGIKITKISFYYDKNITHRNPWVTKLGDSNVRAHSKAWSDLNSINTVLGTDYEKSPNKSTYSAHFGSMDWDEYSPDQLIFDGDTLHLCVY